MQEMSLDKAIVHGVKLTGDVLVAPGTSLLLESEVVAGSLHVIVGLVARALLGTALLGSVGWLVVAANSYSKATTGKNLLQQVRPGTVASKTTQEE
jgi:hypothetical protein